MRNGNYVVVVVVVGFVVRLFFCIFPFIAIINNIVKS